MATPTFELDIRARTLTLGDPRRGAQTIALSPGTFDFETNLERVAVRSDTAELTVGFAGGREAAVELRDATRSLEELQPGRLRRMSTVRPRSSRWECRWTTHTTREH